MLETFAFYIKSTGNPVYYFTEPVQTFTKGQTLNLIILLVMYVTVLKNRNSD